MKLLGRMERSSVQAAYGTSIIPTTVNNYSIGLQPKDTSHEKQVGWCNGDYAQAAFHAHLASAVLKQS